MLSEVLRSSTELDYWKEAKAVTCIMCASPNLSKRRSFNRTLNSRGCLPPNTMEGGSRGGGA